MTFRILLISCILGIVVFLGIVIFSMVARTEQTHLSPSATRPQTGELIPTSEVKQKNPDIIYSKDGTDKLIETAKTRPTPTTQSDATIRDTLVASVGEDGGVLYQSPLVKISYVKVPNDFESEILGGDIDASKTDAISWLKTKGMTEDGICKLPLFFYLSTEARAELKKTGQKFNPISDFCL